MSLPLCATGYLGGVAANAIILGLLGFPLLLALGGTLLVSILALFSGRRSRDLVSTLAFGWSFCNAALVGLAVWFWLSLSSTLLTPGALCGIALTLALSGLTPLATLALRPR